MHFKRVDEPTNKYHNILMRYIIGKVQKRLKLHYKILVILLTFVSLTLNYNELYALTTLEGKKINIDTEQYDKVLESMYGVALGYEYKGYQYTDTAIETYRKLKRICYSKSRFYISASWELGNIYLGKGNDAESIKNFSEIVEGESGTAYVFTKAHVYVPLSQLLIKKREYDKAQRLAIICGDAIQEIKCDIYKKKYSSAYEKTLKLVNNHDTGVIKKVIPVYSETGSESEGVFLLERYYEKRKDARVVLDGYILFANSLRDRKKHGKSNDLINKAKNMRGTDLELYRNLTEMEGDNWVALGNKEKAIICYEQIIWKDKTDEMTKRIYPKLANLYIERGEKESAIKLYKQHAGIEKTLELLNRMGEHDRTIRLIDEILEKGEKK